MRPNCIRPHIWDFYNAISGNTVFDAFVHQFPKASATDIARHAFYLGKQATNDISLQPTLDECMFLARRAIMRKIRGTKP